MKLLRVYQAIKKVSLWGGLVWAFIACETTSSSDGDLDNWWYLTQVDTLFNGKSCDYRENKVFWAFQGTLMHVEIPGMEIRYICTFNNTGTSLIQNQLYLYDRVHGDVPMTQDSIQERNIMEYGINHPTDTFAIESLNSDNMILRDNTLRLHFERY